jgi:hypothetical protein
MPYSTLLLLVYVLGTPPWTAVQCGGKTILLHPKPKNKKPHRQFASRASMAVFGSRRSR